MQKSVTTFSSMYVVTYKYLLVLLLSSRHVHCTYLCCNYIVIRQAQTRDSVKSHYFTRQSMTSSIWDHRADYTSNKINNKTLTTFFLKSSLFSLIFFKQFYGKKLGNIQIICNTLHRFGFLSIANYSRASNIESDNSQNQLFFLQFVSVFLGILFGLIFGVH